MANFGISLIEKLASALIQGDDNLITNLVSRKIEELGADMLTEFLGGELSGALGITSPASLLRTVPGVQQYYQTRNQWLNAVQPKLPRSQIIDLLKKALAEKKQEATFTIPRPPGAWQRWSRSRQEWLDERWKHDWRSQPRDPHGRWIPGRLRHPYISRGARRIRRKRRAAARKAVRGIMSGG